MSIELTKEQSALVEWKAKLMGLTSEELLVREIERRTDQYADERKSEFLAAPETKALLEKLATVDPAKLPDVAAFVETAQKK